MLNGGEYTPKELDQHFRLLGFATGEYVFKCMECKKPYIGAKLSAQCLPCAAKQAMHLIEENRKAKAASTGSRLSPIEKLAKEVQMLTEEVSSLRETSRAMERAPASVIRRLEALEKKAGLSGNQAYSLWKQDSNQ
jgi:hypothetical protein